MSLVLKIGKTNKKINSTSQAFSSSTDYNVLLKDQCSLDRPVFVIRGTPDKYNYCKFMDKYYWIDDTVILSRDTFEVHCHLDPLATYKAQITGSSQFAIFANSSHWNKFADDPRISPEKNLYTYSQYYANCFGTVGHNSLIDDEGCVIMTFFSAVPTGAGARGGLHTAVLTKSMFQNCLYDLSNIDWTDIVEFTELFTKAIQALGGVGNWADNIYSCKWLPIRYDGITGTLRSDMAVGGIIADGVTWKEISTNTVITHSKAVDISDYWEILGDDLTVLRNPRFTSIQINTPAGCINVDVSNLKQQTKITIKTAICVVSGDFTIKVFDGTDTGEVIGAVSGNMGIDLMHMVVDSPNLLTQATQSAFNFGIGGEALAISSQFGGKTGIGGNVLATPIMHQAPSIAISGAPSSLFVDKYLAQVSIVYNTMGPYQMAGSESGASAGNYKSMCNKIGYPCNRYISLSDYSGYVKCYNASVGASGASEADKQFINSCLNNGIYIE